MATQNRISGQVQVPRKPSVRVVEFVKSGHRYSFRFDASSELGLICALLSTALDPRLNLDLEDARKLMESLGLGAAENKKAP